MIQRLQHFLHTDIPLTKDMGLELVTFNNNKLQAIAPLSQNINDKGSVFGGSSSALMIISGWSLIKLNCEEFDIQADIVIHKNKTLWHKASYEDLLINAVFSEEYDFNKIKSVIGKKRHQRIDCKIELVNKDNIKFSTMTANYVIIPKEEG
jgi:thioesterase domain-containing protein